MAEVAKERTNWRDERISKLHREWGVGLLATDIDFLMLEYTKNFNSVSLAALIEYKNEHAAKQVLTNQQYVALRKLAEPHHMPFFAVRYSDDLKHFFVVPGNEYAKEFLEKRRDMTEEEFVKLLYRVRGEAMSISVLEKIKARTVGDGHQP